MYESSSSRGDVVKTSLLRVGWGNEAQYAQEWALLSPLFCGLSCHPCSPLSELSPSAAVLLLRHTHCP